MMQNISNISSVLPDNPPTVEGGAHLSKADLAKLWSAAKELETTFSSYLLKDMKVTQEGTDVEEGFAGDVYGDMFKRSLAEQLSRSQSLGLAKQIYQDSAKLAEKANGLAGTPSVSTSSQTQEVKPNPT